MNKFKIVESSFVIQFSRRCSPKCTNHVNVLLITHWVHERILTSNFRWLAPKKWYGKPVRIWSSASAVCLYCLILNCELLSQQIRIFSHMCQKWSFQEKQARTHSMCAKIHEINIGDQLFTLLIFTGLKESTWAHLQSKFCWILYHLPLLGVILF